MGGRAWTRAGFFIVLVFFCAPLFVNLGGLDLRNDEPIYAYAVNRILETGEWLTPRSIVVDGPFLEKPPLKFWMTAALIRSGLVTNDEFGMRILDAVMGAAGFIYVYFIGLRLAGPLCGVASALTLFAMDWLLFAHGLRSNNMEAPLFLAYCGAMYHVIRWIEAPPGRRLHAHAVGAYFVLGFMTKFVAALFLPMIIGVSLVTIPVMRQRVHAHGRDWLLPIALALAVIAPWFVYETIEYGGLFWQVILGEHIYTRFTGALDPSHLRPWHYYFTETWTELTYAEVHVMAVVAAMVALVRVWRGDPWQMRLLLAWWLVPFALMSVGTSKLYHYTYPFLPPIALAVGWLASAVMLAASGATGRRLADVLGHYAIGGSTSGRRGARIARRVLLLLAAAAFGLAMLTGLTGQVVWRVGATKIFQNSSVARPLFTAAVLLGLAGFAGPTLRPVAVLILALGLPLAAYPVKAAQVRVVDHRWSALRQCAAEASGGRDAATGVLVVGELKAHPPYYYLYRLGPWTETRHPDDPEVRTRLFAAERETPVLLTPSGYARLQQVAHEARWAETLPEAVLVDEHVVMLPGPYHRCASAAIRAGAARLTPGQRR